MLTATERKLLDGLRILIDAIEAVTYGRTPREHARSVAAQLNVWRTREAELQELSRAAHEAGEPWTGEGYDEPPLEMDDWQWVELDDAYTRASDLLANAELDAVRPSRPRKRELEEQIVAADRALTEGLWR